jgi:sigma-B regulation protein RsbU (phosphoserine phosphatase)
MSASPPPRFRSLTWRLVAWILACAGLVFAIALLRSYGVARQMVEGAAHQEATSVVAAVVNRLDRSLKTVDHTTGLLAAVLMETQPSGDELGRLLEALLGTHPNVHGAAVAYEPRAFSADRERFGLYRSRGTDGRILAMDLTASPSTYWEKEWYTKAATSRAPRWSSVETDERGGGRALVTFSRPLLASDGTLRGVAMIDLDLLWLSEAAARLPIGRGGFVVVLSPSGQVLANSRDPGRLGIDLSRESDPALAHIVRRMLTGQTGFEPIVGPNGQRARVVYAAVEGVGWSVAAVYPEETLFREARDLGFVATRLLVLGLVLLALVVAQLARRLTLPLRALAASAPELGAGNLDTALPEVRSHDEIGALTRAFVAMRDSLKAYIANLERTTAAKQRLESEVRIAHRVQMAMLPEREARGEGFELSATLIPARTVGGDLYDHFVSDGRLVFMVGDVSGKGVGPALFMARAKTFFEVSAARHDDPSQVLADVNRGLCAENEEGMFVTVWCGSLDLATGALRCAVGGHDAPYLLPADGPPRQLELDGGPLLGLMDGATFPENRATLAPGDLLLLYSDGVSEAMDPQGRLFSLERIGEVLSARPASADAARDLVLDAVRSFAAGAQQSDDITIMAVRRLGAEPR